MYALTDMLYKKAIKEFFRKQILGIAVLDAKEIYFYNESFAEMFDLTEEQQQSETQISAFLEKIEKNDRQFLYRLLNGLSGGNIAEQGSFSLSSRGEAGAVRTFSAAYAILILDGEFQLSLIIEEKTKLNTEISVLRHRAKMYAAIMENKNQSVILIDRAYHIIDYNHLAYTNLINVFGIVPEIDINFFNTFKGDSASIFHKLLTEGLSGKELHREQEFEEDNNKYWFEISIIPIANEKNEVDTVALLALDITARKLTEQALQSSERRFRMVLENAGVGIVTVDATGQILFANRRFCKIIQYNLFELQEMNVMELTVAGDKSETMKNFKLLQQGKVQYISREKLMLQKNGQQIWVNLTVTSYDQPDENTDAYIGIMEDISQRKKTETELIKSERRFRNVFENASIGIYRISPEGKVLLANPALIAMLGYSSFNDFAQRDIEKEVYFDASNREIFLRIMQEHGEVNGFETVWRKADGSPVNIIENARALKDELGNTLYYEGEVEDITERKRVTGKLKQSEKQLRALAAHLQSVREAEREAIAREIHDEFGQVLTSLKMNMSFLSKSLGDSSTLTKEEMVGELQAMSEMIDASVGTMKTLITELRPQMLDNLGFIDAAENLLQEFKQHSGMQTTFFSNIEELSINQNARMVLYRIVQEALNNVMKHAHASSVSLLIRQRNKNIIVSVKDNGKGFCMDEIDSQRSFGIIGMKERAHIEGWKLDIQTGRNEGTTINIIL